MDDPPDGLELLEHEDFCRSVRHGAEHQRLDYKGPMAWDGKHAECIGLVKDILALANIGGGRLVIGVTPAGDGTYELTGLSPDQAATWDTTPVSDTVQTYAEPPVSFTVRVDACEGKQFAVVSVAGFSRVPHLAKKAYPSDGSKPKITQWGLYVRTAGCQSRPVQSAAEFQDVIDRAVRLRQSEMLTEIRSILTGASITTNDHSRDAFLAQAEECKREMSVESPDAPFDGVFTDLMFPSMFLTDRFSIDQLREGIGAASITYRGAWPFLAYQGWGEHTIRLVDGYRMEYGEPIGAPVGTPGNRYFYWRIRQSGLLAVRSLAWEVDYYGTKGQRVLLLSSIVSHVAQAIDTLVRLYTGLRVTDEDITWKMEFSGARGRRYERAGGPPPFESDRSTTEDVVSFQRTRSLEDWRAGLVDHASEAIADLYEQVGVQSINMGRIAKEVRDHLGISS